MSQRQIGSHDLNSRSNRSHCITDIHVHVGTTTIGRISLVDLAGSERLKNTNSSGNTNFIK